MTERQSAESVAVWGQRIVPSGWGSVPWRVEAWDTILRRWAWIADFPSKEAAQRHIDGDEHG